MRCKSCGYVCVVTDKAKKARKMTSRCHHCGSSLFGSVRNVSWFDERTRVGTGIRWGWGKKAEATRRKKKNIVAEQVDCQTDKHGCAWG